MVFTTWEIQLTVFLAAKNVFLVQINKLAPSAKEAIDQVFQVNVIVKQDTTTKEIYSIVQHAFINAPHAKMELLVRHAKEITGKVNKIIAIVCQVFMIQEIK